MAIEPARRPVVVDANLIINLVHAERLTLLGTIPGYDFVVPDDVVAEIVDPTQRTQLSQVVEDDRIRVVSISEPDDLVRYAELRRALGRGEAACLVIAMRNGWVIASDEKGRFQREALATVGAGRLMNTAGLFVLAIRAGLMSVDDADRAKAILEQHRFRLPFGSFRDRSIPVTWVTVYSDRAHRSHFRAERVLDRLQPARLIVEAPQVVMHEGHEPDALAELRDAHILPAKTWRRFTFRPLKQIRPQLVTVMV